MQRELGKIEKQVEQLLDRIVDAQSATVVSAYGARIQKLEENKLILSESMESIGRPVRDCDDSLRTALQFLSNPWKLWVSDRFEDKQTVLKLTFADRLVYDRNGAIEPPKPPCHSRP